MWHCVGVHMANRFLCGIVWVCTWQTGFCVALCGCAHGKLMFLCVCVYGMCACMHNRLRFMYACVCCVCVANICFCVCERALDWLPNGLVLFQTLHLSLLVTLWLGFVLDTTPERFVGYSMAWFVSDPASVSEWIAPVDSTTTGSLTALFVSDSAPLSAWMVTQC